jgi:hypothetical protein
VKLLEGRRFGAGLDAVLNDLASGNTEVVLLDVGAFCTGNSGSVMLSPGLSSSAHVQNISIKGTLSGCTGSTVTKGKYVARLKTVNAASCTALGSPGEATTGTIVIKWGYGSGNSMGSFSMPLTEVPGVSLGGTLASGPFSGDTISGTVSQTYTDGSKCGVPRAGMKAKKVKKGRFTGSAVEIA